MIAQLRVLDTRERRAMPLREAESLDLGRTPHASNRGHGLGGLHPWMQSACLVLQLQCIATTTTNILAGLLARGPHDGRCRCKGPEAPGPAPTRPGGCEQRPAAKAMPCRRGLGMPLAQIGAEQFEVIHCKLKRGTAVGPSEWTYERMRCAGFHNERTWEAMRIRQIRRRMWRIRRRIQRIRRLNEYPTCFAIHTSKNSKKY